MIGLRTVWQLSILALVLLLAPSSSLAQETPVVPLADGEPFAAAKAGKFLRAYRILGVPPVIDGRLDDEVWALAGSMDDLVQWEPNNMAPPSERTVTQVAFDDRNLYVAIRLFDRSADGVTAGLGRRDDFPPTDQISVGFDPRHDHQTAYIFQTNPSGVQGDMRRFDDTRIDRDYDAVWEVQAEIVAEGWVAEFRIPFSQMRFSVPTDGEAVWGFNIRRTIQRNGESAEWVGRPRGEQGNVSRWGHLMFAEASLSPPRRMELLPYVLGGATRSAGATGDDGRVAGGLDVRYGLGSSATLSATFNPDFGQVEQDPAVLNLSVFETFFPERRPFFLEDSRTFQPNQQQFSLFHSRRIGRRPGHLSLDADDVVVERPVETTILGASKVTGKTGVWTYGAMTALTDREYALVETEGDGSFEPDDETTRRLIEPMTSYNVVRVQRDLGASSNLGGLVTATVRERTANAFSGGIDHNFRWQQNRWQWSGLYALTHAPGPDGLRTGFGGTGGMGFSGKYVGLNSFYSHTGRHFRVNDLGFLRGRIDQTQVGLAANVGQPDPWKIFRRVRAFGQVFRGWNGDGLQLTRQVGGGFNVQFLNFWSVGSNLGRFAVSEDDLDTRGGPPILRPAGVFFNLFVNSDSRKTWSIGGGLFGNRDEAGGGFTSIGPRVSVQLSPRIQASVSTRYNFGNNVAQWVTNTDVTGDGVVDPFTDVYVKTSSTSHCERHTPFLVT